MEKDWQASALHMKHKLDENRVNILGNKNLSFKRWEWSQNHNYEETFFSVALMKKSIDAVLENDMDMADLYLTEGKEV